MTVDIAFVAVVEVVDAVAVAETVVVVVVDDYNVHHTGGSCWLS